MDKYFAAIDLGTNSCRLLIADKQGKYLLQDTCPVRLGEGMHETCIISEDAFKRALDCFISFKKSMDKYKVTKYKAIATAACRKATNSEKFIKAVKEESGIKLEVIDGYEEALLNLEGAMMNCDKSKKYVAVFDMGGGSTEVTLAETGKTPKILHSVSIPWGARNSSEAFDFSAYDEKKANNLRAEINLYMKDFLVKSNYEKYKNDVCVVATSSGPLRVAAIQHGFDKYDREKADGLIIDMTRLNDIWDIYYKMSVKEMADSPMIGENRSKIFIPGCVIFDTVLKQNLKADKVIASLKSAKDGIIRELIKDE